MDQPTILYVNTVQKRYATMGPPAIEALSLTLRQGELMALLGPSGCGKTTLLRLIAGFEATATGQIIVAGRPVDGGGVWVPPEARDIGIVFQDYALFPHLTVAKNVAFGLQAQRTTRPRQQRDRHIQARVAETLALVGLQGLEQRYPHELSGGQQQRVALARALAPQPALILLDEPFSNLDVEVRLRLREEVRDILKKSGISAIFVTHDQEEALAISDRVAVMRAGHLEQVGTPEELYHTPASRFVAGFVTQANFLPAHWQGQSWQTEVGNFAVDPLMLSGPEAQPASAESAIATIARSTPREAISEGELMIRQEDLILQPDEGGEILIRDRQFLGREYRYCLKTPSGRELHARSYGGQPLAIGTRVKLAVTNQSLRFFPHANHRHAS